MLNTVARRRSRQAHDGAAKADFEAVCRYEVDAEYRCSRKSAAEASKEGRQEALFETVTWAE